MQVGELAGIAVGATVMVNILIAGYVPTHFSRVTPKRILKDKFTNFSRYLYVTTSTPYHNIAVIHSISHHKCKYGFCIVLFPLWCDFL